MFFHASQFTDPGFPITVPVGGLGGPNITALQNSLNADGWVFAYPSYCFDRSVNGTVRTITNQSNDCANDSGNGSRQVNTLLLWWDHMLNYLGTLYGSGRPILVAGFSLGAWAAVTVALGRTSSVVGYIAHALPTIWSNITFQGTSFPANTSGMDLSATALNALTIPGIIGYCKTDGVVGWGLATDTGYLGPPVSNTNHMILNAQAVPQPVTGYESTTDEGTSYPNGHLFLTADATEYCTTPPTTTGWVNTTLDPLVPANTF